MCVICDRVAMRVVAVDFSDIPADEQARIIEAIESAYDGTGRRAHVIDMYYNTFRRCPAYPPDADGGEAIVHTGHCTGAFDREKCKHYDASKFYINEQCRLRVRRGLA